ncbi:MAG: DUF4194 domain-containing protein [Treponema sp.]|nr:DUF4194 domain-containing protein [Treponema sp.]
MRREIYEIGRISELSDDEFDLFSQSLKTLLAKTFIIRGIDRDDALYNFTVGNTPLFDAWLSCMDAELFRDEGLGIIAFRGDSGIRLRLNLEETCALLTFRLIYEEKRTEVFLTNFPTVTVFDFVRKYEGITGATLKKTRLAEILRRLSAYKLIGVHSEDSTDMDTLIPLYPSIAVSVSLDSIEELLKQVNAVQDKAQTKQIVE